MIENRFEQQIRALEPWQQMLFATALTERMFLNFALFSRLMNFGDLERMGNLLNSVWEEQTQRGTKVNYEVQLNHVEDNIADLDEYERAAVLAASRIRSRVDQAAADPVLQPLQRRRDRGLSQVHLACCIGDRLRLRQNHKGAQQVPVQFPQDAVGG